MTTREVLTYLEMTHPDQLRAAPPVRGLHLAPAEGDPRRIRAVQECIASRHHWTRLGWSDAQWDDWLADGRRRHWFIRVDDRIAGIVELELHGEDEIEIGVFGLTPEHIGRGLGGHALTLTTALAWAARPPAVSDVRRVWLYTSELDHPGALPNYRRRGFTVYRTMTRARPDLDLPARASTSPPPRLGS
jgi:GNAT superfamily N-acetyltransferase